MAGGPDITLPPQLRVPHISLLGINIQDSAEDFVSLESSVLDGSVIAERGSDGLSDKTGQSSRIPSGLLVECYLALRGVWRCSTFRLVVCEIGKLPYRIAAILGDSYLRYGPAVPDDPRQNGQMSLRQESKFLFASTDDIKRLSLKHPWMGPLDQQLAGEAYRAGAALAFGISDSCNGNSGSA